MGYFKDLGNAILGRKMAAGYNAASTNRRLAMFQASREHINSLLASSGDTLRARCRKSVRENPWAAGAIEDWVSDTVGKGIIPYSRHSDDGERQKLKDLWSWFTDEADAAGVMSVYGLQALAFRSALEGGDSFTRLRARRETDGLKIPLQLQVLEAEHVPMEETKSLENGREVRCGIEFNSIGKRLAYHMYRQHPGDNLPNPRVELSRVDAASVLHQYAVVRPGQIRGEPKLVRALITLWQLEQYLDAELERKKLAAFIAGFIQRNGDDDVGGLATSSSISETAEAAGTYEQFAKIQPGSFPVVDIDGQITFSSSPDVGNSYEPFVRSQLRPIARAVDLSYEQLTGDLSEVNYSSIRAGLIKYRRIVDMVRANSVVWQWCRPVWKSMVEAAVFAGEISATNYRKYQSEYLNVRWIAPKWDWIDPLKDGQSDVLEIEARLASRRDKIAERGRDIDEVDEEIRQEEPMGPVSERSRSATPRSDVEPEQTRRRGVIQ